MLFKPEIVTPHNADSFIKRISAKDPKINMLCLELVHWGYSQVLVWVSQVIAAQRKDPTIIFPLITLHGWFDDLDEPRTKRIKESGMIWIPRSGKKNEGKGCLTIICEMEINHPTAFTNPLVEDEEEQELDDYVNASALSDEDFQRIIEETMAAGYFD